MCLQFPDELLGISSKIYEELKRGTEADIYILGDTSYARYKIVIPYAEKHIASILINSITEVFYVHHFNIFCKLCFSCCVDVVASMHVQSDAIVHYGHTCFSKANIPVYIVLNEKPLNVDYIMKILKENLKDYIPEKICLFYDCEFEHIKGRVYLINV